MKTTMMKKIAACLLALLMVVQIMPVFADTVISDTSSLSATRYRDKLEVTGEASIIVVGAKIQLKATEGYTLSWSSSNEGVATVDETGLVTAVGEGSVKITASEGSEYSDSVTLKVLTGAEETGGQKDDKIVIVINASKDKVTYDGEVHQSGYTAVANVEGFDPSLVKMVNTDRVVSQKNCNVYPVSYLAEDFIYEGPETAEFVMSDGWLQIKPATIEVKANNAEKKAGEPDPELTASITSGKLYGNDTISYNVQRMDEGEEAGDHIIEVTGEELQGNYRIKYLAGTLTIRYEGINGTYLLGNAATNSLLTSVYKPSEKRMKAISYQEVSGGQVLCDEDVSGYYWTFTEQPSGKCYISCGGQYLNISDAKLTVSSTPQELIVNVLSNGKLEIKNDKGYRVNVKSNSTDLGFQGSTWNTRINLPTQDNEMITLYRGATSGAEGKSILVFNANGSESKAPKAITVNSGSSVILPEMNGTGKDGSKFLGWADVNDFTSKVPNTEHTYHELYPAGSSYVVKDKEVTLYAVWNNTNKKVQFGIRMDGEIQDEPNGYSPSKYYGHFTVENAVKDGKWIIDVNTGKPIKGYYVDNNVTKNLSYIPTAQEINTALQNEGGASFDPETQYVHWYVLKYAKGGWHVDGVIRNKATKSIGYDANLPATEKTAVKNLPAGFSVTPGTEIKAGSDSSGKIQEPSLAGYSFAGWNTKPDGKGVKYESGAAVTMNEDITLYPMWVKMRIRITSNWPEKAPAKEGSKITLTAVLEGFETKEYDYLQWQHSTDLENWVDEPGAQGINFTYKLDATTAQYTWRVVAINVR